MPTIEKIYEQRISDQGADTAALFAALIKTGEAAERALAAMAKLLASQRPDEADPSH